MKPRPRRRTVTTAAFERVAHVTPFVGEHVSVSVDTYRYADGRTSRREVVELGEVVVVCAYDGDAVYLVGQPREAVGQALLWELPAGGVDARDHGDPLLAAQRELAEETGKGARAWEHVHSFYSSPGTLNERVHLFFARGLYDDTTHDPDASERLEVRQAPLVELDALISECADAKSLVGLLLLQCRLDRVGAGKEGHAYGAGRKTESDGCTSA